VWTVGGQGVRGYSSTFWPVQQVNNQSKYYRTKLECIYVKAHLGRSFVSGDVWRDH